MKKTEKKIITSVIILVLSISSIALAQNENNLIQNTLQQLNNLSVSLKILFLITILSLAPSILITFTSFVRIVIVLSLLRHALGIPQSPPNQVIISLALFLTFFVMRPVFEDINKNAIQPYIKQEIGDMQALSEASKPIKEFMLKNTRKEDLKLFIDLSGEKPKSPEDIGMITLIPAFLISEIKTAFEIVFLIFLPFLIIDLLIASILMSMGMMMIPPMMISLPFKLILFVLADGWELLIKGLIESYR
ncbi:MAG: flagellar biosynthetic protein FliP [Hydrogenothermus sp.]|nr:MAG: flagellar biosynthetic protein FliP [Hydrogenothermus sp.]